MYQRPFSLSSAAALFSTVFLCPGYTHTLAAQDRSQVLDEAKQFDSRLDLIAPERLDPHRGETVLWGVEQENEAAKLEQQFAEVKVLIQKAHEADDDDQLAALRQKFMILVEQKKRLDPSRSANENVEATQHHREALRTDTGSERKGPSELDGPEQVRALHEATERLQNSGLKEIAHELHQRAKMLEKEMVVRREQSERTHKKMIEHKQLMEKKERLADQQQLEQKLMHSELAPQNPERRLHELSEQVESLQRSVKELNEKMNHILELLRKQQAQAK